jgi:Zn-dependent peptidase ImmA (M78 family)
MDSGVTIMGLTAQNLLTTYGKQGTLEEYEAVLNATYIRSQVQLALSDFGGKGHEYKAENALEVFGIQTLLKVVREGSTPLIPNASEPSGSLRRRREAIHVSTSVFAKATSLPEDVIISAETPGKVTPVRYLQRIAQKLGLDDSQIGIIPDSGGDARLGVRLRELGNGHENGFSSKTVLDFAEAAWVISRQNSLAKSFRHSQHRLLSENKDHNYNYPTYERGYELARNTRFKLGLFNDEPIDSVRSLLEKKLGIPVIQLQLPDNIAGATIANGSDRGIVVNERGKNENVCVRRMTMCHELGHLLWDPDEKLNRLMVDDYPTNDDMSYNSRDTIEIRANAFAVAFLAPLDAVRTIHRETGSLERTVCTVAERYKIGGMAARYHVQNILAPRLETITVQVPDPLQEWSANENLMIDFFPLDSTPISRKGRFASYVAQALVDGYISEDSAAVMLQCEKSQASSAARDILERAPL